MDSEQDPPIIYSAPNVPPPDNLEQPPWRRAVRFFLAEPTFTPGALVPLPWLFEAFGLNMPTDTTPYAIAKETQIAFMDQFGRFKGHLLYEHRVDLDSVFARGYLIVPPTVQVSWAEAKSDKELRKSFAKRGARVTYVDTNALDAQGRQERMEALARAGRLRQSMLVEKRAPHTPPGD